MKLRRRNRSRALSERWSYGWRAGLAMIGTLLLMAVALALACVALLGLAGAAIIVLQTVSGFPDVETLETASLALTMGLGAVALLVGGWHFINRD